MTDSRNVRHTSRPDCRFDGAVPGRTLSDSFLCRKPPARAALCSRRRHAHWGIFRSDIARPGKELKRDRGSRKCDRRLLIEKRAVVKAAP